MLAIIFDKRSGAHVFAAKKQKVVDGVPAQPAVSHGSVEQSVMFRCFQMLHFTEYQNLTYYQQFQLARITMSSFLAKE